MPTRRVVLAAAAAGLASACTGRSGAPAESSASRAGAGTGPTAAPPGAATTASSAGPSAATSTSPSATASTATASPTPASTGASSPAAGATGSARAGEPQVITTGLAVPWGVAFGRDGGALVSERDTARLLRLSPSGAVAEIGVLPGVAAVGEGGLLGLAVSPDPAGDGQVWAFHSTSDDNRIVRFPVADPRAATPVLRGIATAANHNGGRIAFGPDGFLYATTGDALDPDRAQDRRSLNGKVLRITADGRPAPSNPDPGSPVYTYGHRNSEGLAWGPGGRLYEAEFGASTADEINLLTPGANYGWPIAEGRDPRGRFVQPLVTWPTSECSPSGIAFTPSADGGALWVGALRGECLWRIPVAADGGLGEPEALFAGRFGRIRTVAAAPDGSLWLTTSNRDGRGSPVAEDDRVIRVPLR